MRRVTDSQRGRKVARCVTRFWVRRLARGYSVGVVQVTSLLLASCCDPQQFVLHNSFMAANVLWLLAPLGCFLIAIMVPQYLTTAIRYVDVLTTRASGQQALVGNYEKGTMRSIVQEIVDVKLSAMSEELALLRTTMQAQEREVGALRVLHESLRQVHDEQQKKFSLADSSSAISIHIERVISKHTEELVRKAMCGVDHGTG